MIRFPGTLTADSFLAGHWQKKALYLPNAIEVDFPALTQNELGWLATLDDVESRIVFTDRSGSNFRYSAETGPFDEAWLRQLPAQDWTLLVHDVEKHLPEMREIFHSVPFIPDWRIDDLMISFAAPGGSVGPHKDNYDVFLLQGTGQRDWVVSTAEVPTDPSASDDLALLQAFSGDAFPCTQGDVLYLPPNVPHWGTANSACMTYSIGMRAPQVAELLVADPEKPATNPVYSDPDLAADESIPGYISPQAIARARDMAGPSFESSSLGRCVTATKDWLRPEGAHEDECDSLVDAIGKGGTLSLHGMARLAWDDAHVYVNGASLKTDSDISELMTELCRKRSLAEGATLPRGQAYVIRWLLQNGAFELPEIA